MAPPSPSIDRFDDTPDVPPGPPIEDHPAVSDVALTLFPGENFVEDGQVWMGRIYVRVRGTLIKDYEACCGPPPGAERGDQGGHRAAPTPAGAYTLGPMEHHTTPGWPRSVIPWGAALRLRSDGDIEYSADGSRWFKATGLDGFLTRAEIHFEQRTRADQAAAQSLASGQHVAPAPITQDDQLRINAGCRTIFFDAEGHLLPFYDKNDFGNWSWPVLDDGQRTEYFVHTTPGNEAAFAARRPYRLTQSHGCIHIRVEDRDEMMARGYLQPGVAFAVTDYGLRGPTI
jgi:hypothetical protein